MNEAKKKEMLKLALAGLYETRAIKNANPDPTYEHYRAEAKMWLNHRIAMMAIGWESSKSFTVEVTIEQQS